MNSILTDYIYYATGRNVMFMAQSQNCETNY